MHMQVLNDVSSIVFTNKTIVIIPGKVITTMQFGSSHHKIRTNILFLSG